MRIAAVDDEGLCMSSLIYTIREQFPDAQINEYNDGAPAWEAIQKDHNIDLLITDIRMVTMHGIELAEKVHQQYPDIQILFQTGESEGRLRQMGLQIERCLYKPLYGPELRNKIDHINELPPFEIKKMIKEEQRYEEIRKQPIRKKQRGLLQRMFG